LETWAQWGHMRAYHTGYVQWSPAQRIVFLLDMASCALWEREGFPAYRKKSAHCSWRAKKYGEQLGLVGPWWSGQEHRVLSGIDGVLLVVVIGEGKLVVPVDFAIRRPDPHGPGAPCRDKLHWVQVMLDGRMTAFRRRGLVLPPPVIVADSWFS
jgi:hypothetical protein